MVNKSKRSRKASKKRRSTGLATSLSRMLFNFIKKTTADEPTIPILIEHYQIMNVLRSGTFGQVFLAINTHNQLEVAAKVEPVGARYPQLHIEYQVYEILEDDKPGFIKVYYFGQFHHKMYNILIMELLGPDLNDLFIACHYTFSHKTVLMIAVQTLKLIKYIHSKNIIYRDIKPENFCIGHERTNKNNIIYVIDFGLAKINEPLKPDQIMKIQDYFVGTTRYMSIHAHRGFELSERDDLESLGYMYAYFLKGKLPWMNVIKLGPKEEFMDKIATMKVHFNLTNFNPYSEFIDYFHYVNGLKFRQKPNYNYLIDLFETSYKKYKYENDNIFDWSEIMQKKYLVNHIDVDPDD